MKYAQGGHIHPIDHGDSIPAMLSPGVYVPTAEDPRVTGRILLQLMDNTPEVVVGLTASAPDEYNTTLVRALRALADEIESGSPAA